MRTSFLDLLFLEPRPSGLPDRPISHVYVKGSSPSDCRGVPKDLILITPDAKSFRELDCYIDLLQKELEQIRKEARKKYSTAELRKSRSN